MVFGRKKKKKPEVKEPEDVLPEAPEPEEELPEAPEPEEETNTTEYEETIEELNAKIKALKNKKPKKEEKIGSFSLDAEEMTLAVNALADSEEFKAYQQMVIGQQIAEIIAAYNKVVGEKSESEDAEELPSPE